MEDGNIRVIMNCVFYIKEITNDYILSHYHVNFAIHLNKQKNMTHFDTLYNKLSIDVSITLQ